MIDRKSFILLLLSLGIGVTLALLYFSTVMPSEREDANFENDTLTPDLWRMRTISINGSGMPVSVWQAGYTLRINGTHISGEICNGFGGGIEYLNSSTIKGQDVFATTMLCDITLGEGPDLMEVEELFLDGVAHGMTISEGNNMLELRDILTKTTFVYGKGR